MTMAAALLTIAICLGAGWPLSMLLDRDARVSLRLATSFLLGSAVGGAVLFLLSLVQIHWSRGALLVGMLSIAAIAAAASSVWHRLGSGLLRLR